MVILVNFYCTGHSKIGARRNQQYFEIHCRYMKMQQLPTCSKDFFFGQIILVSYYQYSLQKLNSLLINSEKYFKNLSCQKCQPTCTWLVALKRHILETHKEVHATRYKSVTRAIIEAEQNIFRHFHEHFAYCRFQSPDFVHILYINTY